MPLHSQATAPELALSETLYASGTTRVFRSHAASGGARVVWKEYLGPRASRRLKHESDMLVRLVGIEGVVQPAAAKLHGDVLALQDGGGQPLSQLTRSGACETGVVLSVAVQLARALAGVHRAGVIHRDVNPSNILIAPDGRTQLIDFDLAVLAEQHVLAGRDEIVGTLAYLAPEQTGRTGRTVDQRADLYALGATLYEMACGRRPFESQDALQLIHGHLVREPEPPSRIADVPAGLSAIIMRLLAKAPEQRYESLEQRVEDRTRELRETQAQLVDTARRAGKAEIANNVLHNVGNVFNSITVSASTLRQTIARSGIDRLARAAELMNTPDFAQLLEQHPRGNALRTYLNELAASLQEERQHALDDLDRLARSVEHISHVLATQQLHAGFSRVLELTDPAELLEEALRLSAEALLSAGVTVVRRYEDIEPVPLDRQRLVQIIVNLVRNAAQAMRHIPEGSRVVTLGLALAHDGSAERLRISVKDEGEGIAPENLNRLFAHGFTTRREGHGFGLHSSAVAAMEMDGTLKAHSDGPGRGAVFTIDIPVRTARH